MMNPQCSKRFVFHAGPGKTGTTSVQKFLGRELIQQHGRIVNGKVGKVSNWTLAMGRPAPLCHGLRAMENSKEDSLRLIDEASQWTRKNIASGMKSSNNMFISCEEACHTWTKDPQGHALKSIMDAMGVGGTKGFCPEFVFAFRSPRLDHFLSAWKEFTGGPTSEKPKTREPSIYAVNSIGKTFPSLKNASVHKMVCDKTIDPEAFRFYFQRFINPLGSVLDFRRMPHQSAAFTSDSSWVLDWPVTIIDMTGISKNNRDMSHVIACDVLGWPCMDGWFGGDLHVDESNKNGTQSAATVIHTRSRKRGVVDLNKRELSKLEQLLRMRDCAYRDAILADPQIRILYEDDIWPDCPEVVPESYQQLVNITFFSDQMERIMGCAGSDTLPAFEELDAELDKHTISSLPEVDEATKGDLKMMTGMHSLPVMSSITFPLQCMGMLILFFMLLIIRKRCRRNFGVRMRND